MTDDGGAFWLRGLPAGPARILVQAGGETGATALELSSGAHLSLAVTLAPAVWISGRGTDPAGHPTPGLPVEGATGFPTARFGLYAAAVSDAAGRFRLGPFAPGPVSVRPGWGGLPAKRDDPARTIEVVAGRLAEVTLAVPRPVAVGNQRGGAFPVALIRPASPTPTARTP